MRLIRDEAGDDDLLFCAIVAKWLADTMSPASPGPADSADEDAVYGEMVWFGRSSDSF